MYRENDTASHVATLVATLVATRAPSDDIHHIGISDMSRDRESVPLKYRMIDNPLRCHVTENLFR